MALQYIPCAQDDNNGEQITRNFLMSSLANTDGILLGNYHLPGDNGTWECDLVLFNQRGVWIIEVKDWRGRIHIDQVNWQREDGLIHHSPLTSVETKAKKLAAVLENAGFRNISVVGLVVLAQSSAELLNTDGVKIREPHEEKVFHLDARLTRALTRRNYLSRLTNKELSMELIQKIVSMLLPRKIDPEQERIKDSYHAASMSKSAYQGPRIYLSHSSEDNEFGVRLVEDLRRALGDDSAIWYDIQGGLHLGETWWQRTAEELTSRDVFIVILSPNAMDSRLVKSEIDMALKQNKLIIPVLYKPCEIPAYLRTIQYVSFLTPRTYQGAFNTLLAALGQLTDSKTRSSTSRRIDQEAVFQPPRIFTAHSHEDNDFGAKLVQDLRRVLGEDTSVWYDTAGGLRGGDSWWRKIVEELTSRNFFIVILSPDAMASKWVDAEIDLAWRQNSSEDGRRIIPVLYRQCKIRDDLATLQVISFLPPKTYDAAFNELLIALGLSVNEEVFGRVSEANIKRWLDEGNAHYRANRFEEALVAYERAIQLEPNSALAYYNKGRVLSSLERYQEAQQQYQRALEIFEALGDRADMASSYHQLGILAYLEGDYQEARRQYQRALEIFEELGDRADMARGYHQLGILAQQQGDYQEAQQQYQRSLEIFEEQLGNRADMAKSYHQLGILAYLQGDYQEALATFNQALELNPRDTDTWTQKGATLVNLRRYEEALASLDQALFLDPNLADIWNEKGRVLATLERYEEALATFDQALSLNPKDNDAWTQKGITLINLKRYEEALAAFDHALVLDPNLPNVWTLRGITYRTLERYEEALAAFDHALELKPEDATTFYYRGNTYVALKYFQQALADYSRAIELNPTYSQAYYERGWAYADMNRYQEAIADFDQTLKLAPNTMIYYSRGLAYAHLKQYEPAIADYDHALELDSKNVHAYNSRGLAYADLKQYEPAIEDFNQVIALDPQLAWAYAQRGEIYSSTKQYERAIEDFNRALELDPYIAWAFANRGLAYASLVSTKEPLKTIPMPFSWTLTRPMSTITVVSLMSTFWNIKGPLRITATLSNSIPNLSMFIMPSLGR